MRSEVICLCISFHNPEMVKAMLPKLAVRGVSGIGFAAILTKCQVGAGLSIGGRRNWRSLVPLLRETLWAASEHFIQSFNPSY